MADALPIPAAGSNTAVEREQGLSPRARAAVEAGIPDSTRRAYNTDIRRFITWCAENGRDCLPATADTLTEYVTHLTVDPRPPHPRRKVQDTRPLGPATIRRVMAAISVMHKAAALNPPDTLGARKVLAGYEAALSVAKDDATRLRAQPNRVKAAVPATLRAFLEPLDRTTLKGKRDAALLLLGHAIAARASELVSLNIGSITIDDDNRGIAVRVYRKKIKKWTTPKVMFGSNPATCPVRATLDLIEALAAEGRTDGPLFLRQDRHSNTAQPMTRHGKPIGEPDGRMTAQGASDVVEKAAAAAGIAGRYRGHSLRRGFVTAARAASKDLVDIGRHGGWADGSKALLAYIEEDDGWGDRNPLIGIGL